jgi:hypothetical protein
MRTAPKINPMNYLLPALCIAAINAVSLSASAQDNRQFATNPVNDPSAHGAIVNYNVNTSNPDGTIMYNSTIILNNSNTQQAANPVDNRGNINRNNAQQNVQRQIVNRGNGTTNVVNFSINENVPDNQEQAEAEPTFNRYNQANVDVQQQTNKPEPLNLRPTEPDMPPTTQAKPEKERSGPPAFGGRFSFNSNFRGGASADVSSSRKAAAKPSSYAEEHSMDLRQRLGSSKPRTKKSNYSCCY